MSDEEPVGRFREKVWTFFVLPQDLAVLFGLDMVLAQDFWDYLVSTHFLTSDGQLSKNVDLVTLDNDWVAIPERFLPFEHLIRDALPYQTGRLV